MEGTLTVLRHFVPEFRRAEPELPREQSGNASRQRRQAHGREHVPPRQMHDGDVRFREVAGEAIHEAINVGDGPWRNIVIELKPDLPTRADTT